MKGVLRFSSVVLILLIGAAAIAQSVGGETAIPSVRFGIDSAKNPEEVASSLQILGILTILSLAPALLVMTTAFTRIVVVFSFLRTALGTPSIPPNQVVIGLSLFLTFYVMAPTFDNLNDQAVQPYMRKEISFDQAKDKAWSSMRDFMIRQTYKKDLALFANMSGKQYESVEDVGWQELIPAFVLSELKTAFIIGFYIFVPFLVIDLVVASTLMSMGMMMLPPAIVSLPAKVLVFLLADGWTLIVQALIGGFR
ncbi:MAG: flagellar type III secretion system pore protein FliP [Fimbriimonadales bacterium]|nr:flagellar type III secretion system pore protein FliP [Fimbriimonadales bacterium]